MLQTTSTVAVVRPGMASCSSSIPSETTNPATTVRRRGQPKDQRTADRQGKESDIADDVVGIELSRRPRCERDLVRAAARMECRAEQECQRSGERCALQECPQRDDEFGVGNGGAFAMALCT